MMPVVLAIARYSTVPSNLSVQTYVNVVQFIVSQGVQASLKYTSLDKFVYAFSFRKHFKEIENFVLLLQ